jgi:hypothetical protein
MKLVSACFVSFPQGTVTDDQFGHHFCNELQQQLAALDKTLSVFKFDDAIPDG